MSMAQSSSVRYPANKRARTDSVYSGQYELTNEDFSDDEEQIFRKTPASRPLAVTCTHCRTRKIKCDNAKPSCSTCVKSGNDCVYVARLKPGLKAGTGEAMLKRIADLEAEYRDFQASSTERISELEAWQQSFLGQAAVASCSSSSIVGPSMLQQINTRGTFSTSKDTPFGSTIPIPDANFGYTNTRDIPLLSQVSNDGFHTYDEPRDMRSRAYNLTDTLAVSSDPGSQPRLDQDIFEDPTYKTDFHQEVWQDGATLPRDDIVKDLVELYYERIAPSTFILIRHPTPYDIPPKGALAHGIVALSIGFSRDPRLRNFKDIIRSAAKRMVFQFAMEQLSFEVLQALALVAVETIGNGKGIEGWGSISLLTRSAVTADLLREPGMDGPEPGMGNYNGSAGNSRPINSLSRNSIMAAPGNWREDEGQRRLFWLIYALDRYTSTTTGVDPAIPSLDIRRRLPCADKLWQGQEVFAADTFISPLNLGGRHSASLATIHPAGFFVEALELMGRAHALQSRPIDNGDMGSMNSRKEATSAIVGASHRWYHDISPVIGRFDEDGSICPLDLLTHGIYHATILKLESFHAFPTHASTESVVQPYASACMTSARAITVLSCRATVRNDEHAPCISPIFIWCCWIAARVFFVNTCLSARVHIDPEFQILLRSMEAMAEDWPLATEYISLLRRAERKWHALASDTMQHSPATGALSEAVSVLLDLKKTGAQALRVGKYDVTPPEPVREADFGPFRSATPNWPRTNVSNPVAPAPNFENVSAWFDSLDLFQSPYGALV